ncbi:Ig-like domain-containing protein, partial [Brenneria sp. EniD312]|uniref:Ig-like domain-containing protein n=1 Tax=Brenneria sp. EniD312 TaxID=598467 RepID=UPI00058AE584
MKGFSITAKENGISSMVNTSSGELNLSSPSIVTLQANRQEIASMARSGNDLVVIFHSGEKVILQNFYIAGEQGASELVLEDENGALWWIKDPATQPQFESISGIDEIMAGIEGAESAGGTVLPYILAGSAGVAGVIAIASDRHDDDDNERNTRTPEAPTVNISEDGTAISGEAEPGSIVTVTLPDGLTIESIVDTDGSWRVTPEDLLTNGETVSVVVTDPAGNTSTAVIVTAPDTTAPAAPADLLVAEDGSSVSGSAEPGSTVTISDAAGNELGSVTVGDDGSFTVPLTPALTNGEAISAVASDAAGNASAAVSVTAPDATAPSAPADLLVAEDGASVSGSAEAGSTVTISDAAGNELGSVTVGEDGSFTVPLTPALTNGEAISAVASDAAGNVSTAA